MRTQIFYFTAVGGSIRYNVQVVPEMVRTFVLALHAIWANEAFRNVRFHYADVDITIRRITTGEYGFKVILDFWEELQ